MSNPNSGPYASNTLSISLMSVGLAVMTLFVVIRVYTKARIAKKVTWDDVTCAFAVIGAITDYLATVFLFEGGFGTGVPEVPGKNSEAIFHYITIVVVPVTLLFTKLSFYLLYHQIFHHILHLRWLTYAGAVVTTIFYLTSSISHFVYVTPNRGQTIDSMILQNRDALKHLGLALGFFGVISDFYILLIPITGILQLHLAWRRKVGVMLVFLTGLLACTSSIVNLYYRLLSGRSDNDDHSTRPISLLSVLEILIGISCSCMPAFTASLRLHVFPFYNLLKARISSILSSIHLPSFTPPGARSHPNQIHYENLEGRQRNIEVVQSFVVCSEHLELGSMNFNNNNQVKEGRSYMQQNFTPGYS